MFKIVAGVIVSLVVLFGASVVIASYQFTSQQDPDAKGEHYTTSEVIFSALS